MDKTIRIDGVGGCLREIQEADCDKLRNWKNNARTSFFFKGVINEKQQKEWFVNYLKRHENGEDFMFIVEEDGHSIGCLGYRIDGKVVDLYNIIRGERSRNGFTMAEAMNLMLAYIREHYKQRITCKVLKNNPAINWYKKLGFRIVEEEETYFLIEHFDYIEAEGAKKDD